MSQPILFHYRSSPSRGICGSSGSNVTLIHDRVTCEDCERILRLGKGNHIAAAERAVIEAAEKWSADQDVVDHFYGDGHPPYSELFAAVSKLREVRGK